MFSYKIRTGLKSDHHNLQLLYQSVAIIEGGIARTIAEITDEYIDKIITNALRSGYLFVAESEKSIIGSIHAYALGPTIFAHVLGELTILVGPTYQGRGIGAALIARLINEVEEKRPDILRIELVSRESNIHAIKLYERMGFVKEGRLEKRVKGINGFEADIPMAYHVKRVK